MNLYKHNFFRAALLVGVLILLNTTVSVTPVYAATIKFTGTLGVIEVDNGSSIYSRFTVGDTFSGSITYGDSAADATFVDIEPPTSADYVFIGVPYGGYITDASDGSIVTVEETSEVDINNNDMMGDAAELLNNLFGAGSTTSDTIVDSWEAANDTSAPGFGVKFYSLDTSLYPGLDFQALPPALADSDFAIFYIEEEDDDDNSLYLATGILTSITVVPDPDPACGTVLTSNTTLDSDMVCSGTALFMSGAGSDNVILDCAGFGITTTGGFFSPAIFAIDVTGIEIKNCNINATGTSANGIAMTNVTGSAISSNNITTQTTSAHGISISQSSNILVDSNTVSTTGLNARGMQIQSLSSDNVISNNNISAVFGTGLRLRSSSNNNTLSLNTIESAGSIAVDIQSSSNNQLTGNTLESPVSFVRIRNLIIQNGGMSVDNAGNIFAVENNFGGSGGSGGAVTTMVQVDPNTGDSISTVRLVMGGSDLGFGFDSLEIMSDGRFLATRGGNNSSLYEINPVSGEVSLVLLTLPALAGSLNGLQSTGLNTLLATTNRGELLSIDLNTNTGILVGQDGDGWTDLALHPTSGRLYTLSRWSLEPSGTNHLYEVNPATGEIIQEIGDTGDAFLSDIDFSPSGVLYATYLYTIDTTSGLATFIGGFAPDPFEPLSQNNTLTDQTFTATTEAAVQFLEPIDLPPALLLSLDEEAIQIGENSIFVDSAQFPFLDVPARITFENLGGASRILLVDFEDDGTFETCDPPQCTFISFIDGTLIFDVSGFTTYSSEEVTTGVQVCDVNGDNVVNMHDIRAISLNRNQPATGPDDPMDWDQNGVVNILDARGCVSSCTLPRCAVQ